MRPIVVLAVVAAPLCLLAADKPKEADIEKEMNRLQGSWKVVSAESDGKQAKEIEVKGRTMLVKGEVIVFDARDNTTAASYKVDPSTKPRSIDFTFTDSKGKASVRKGIYKLDGDELTICNAPPDAKRPTEFATTVGSKLSMYVLKREKPQN